MYLHHISFKSLLPSIGIGFIFIFSCVFFIFISSCLFFVFISAQQPGSGGLVFLKQAAKIRTKAPSLFEGLFWRHNASKSTAKQETAVAWTRAGAGCWKGVLGRVRSGRWLRAAASVFFGDVFQHEAAKITASSDVWRHFRKLLK